MSIGHSKAGENILDNLQNRDVLSLLCLLKSTRTFNECNEITGKIHSTNNDVAIVCEYCSLPSGTSRLIIYDSITTERGKFSFVACYSLIM